MSKQYSFNSFKHLFTLMRLIYRHPSLLLLGLLLGAGDYGYEVKIARPAMLYQGEPRPVAGHNIDTWFRVLRNHGFILGYSDWRGNPLWVEYALTPVPEHAPSLKRPNRFSTDWRSLNRLDHDSYQKSGYDRGHMAPNYAMGHLYGKLGQADSFLMTNVTPQKAHLNQKVWERLEEAEIDTFAPLFGKIWVVTGPVFSGSVERLSSDWKVEIPDAFFKLYISAAKPPEKPRVLAFLVPQTVQGHEPLAQFVTTIDAIEAQTGLDFFADLDDTVENALEASQDGQPWHLQAVSQLPARY
ncbi:DNA/RNA non-specific endonuclease [Methylovulum psychrotolerans]|uniref:DNA/RNA non-specific endonuclease n=1 Tax=Methylovulum psychrotolerans TaxID=1704499 RepID=UPI001BFFC4E0|nr:DNA/RNA non-specific endonuclease [Methylovulum psychrotolerans]MBT9096947.1 DNA/RNA non-specific endonuclease [Methylovulum psychrotolerans]